MRISSKLTAGLASAAVAAAGLAGASLGSSGANDVPASTDSAAQQQTRSALRMNQIQTSGRTTPTTVS
jgi:hypothetical protein